MAKGDAKRTGKRKTKLEKEAADAVIKAEAAAQIAQVAQDEARMMVEATLDQAMAQGDAAGVEAAKKEKRRLAALKGAETRRRRKAEASAAPRLDPYLDYDGAEVSEEEYQRLTRPSAEARKRAEYRDALLAKLQKKMPDLRHDTNAVPYMKDVTMYRDKDKVHFLTAYSPGPRMSEETRAKVLKPKWKSTAWVRPNPQMNIETEGYVGKRSNFAKWFEL